MLICGCFKTGFLRLGVLAVGFFSPPNGSGAGAGPPPSGAAAPAPAVPTLPPPPSPAGPAASAPPPRAPGSAGPTPPLGITEPKPPSGQPLVSTFLREQYPLKNTPGKDRSLESDLLEAIAKTKTILVRRFTEQKIDAGLPPERAQKEAEQEASLDYILKSGEKPLQTVGAVIPSLDLLPVGTEPAHLPLSISFFNDDVLRRDPAVRRVLFDPVQVAAIENRAKELPAGGVADSLILGKYKRAEAASSSASRQYYDWWASSGASDYHRAMEPYVNLFVFFHSPEKELPEHQLLAQFAALRRHQVSVGKASNLTAAIAMIDDNVNGRAKTPAEMKSAALRPLGLMLAEGWSARAWIDLVLKPVTLGNETAKMGFTIPPKANSAGLSSAEVVSSAWYSQQIASDEGKQWPGLEFMWAIAKGIEHEPRCVESQNCQQWILARAVLPAYGELAEAVTRIKANNGGICNAGLLESPEIGFLVPPRDFNREVASAFPLNQNLSLLPPNLERYVLPLSAGVGFRMLALDTFVDSANTTLRELQIQKGGRVLVKVDPARGVDRRVTREELNNMRLAHDTMRLQLSGPPTLEAPQPGDPQNAFAAEDVVGPSAIGAVFTFLPRYGDIAKAYWNWNGDPSKVSETYTAKIVRTGVQEPEDVVRSLLEMRYGRVNETLANAALQKFCKDCAPGEGKGEKPGEGGFFRSLGSPADPAYLDRAAEDYRRWMGAFGENLTALGCAGK